jgi:hypothetical protein
VNDKFIKYKGLNVTGIGATACGWHWCFCPGAVVDFQKGEKYVFGGLRYFSPHGSLDKRTWIIPYWRFLKTAMLWVSSDFFLFIMSCVNTSKG